AWAEGSGRAPSEHPPRPQLNGRPCPASIGRKGAVITGPEGGCDHTLKRSVLRLLTVHRILIASGIAVCLLYAGREVANYANAPGTAPLIHAALAIAAAAVLALYLRSIRRL